MLTERHSPCACGNPRAGQSGVVLLITLIVLVVMTLTAIALVRSMDTTNIIAGNLAFQQSATHSSDAGVEAAVGWLETNTATLQDNNYTSGYSASFCNPGETRCTGVTTWDAYWTTYLAGRTVTLAKDAVGNTVSYAIERLCLTAGVLPGTIDPILGTAGCANAPATSVTTSSSEDAGTIKLNASAQWYYRITTLTVGPHNSKSFIQVIVAL